MDVIDTQESLLQQHEFEVYLEKGIDAVLETQADGRSAVDDSQESVDNAQSSSEHQLTVKRSRSEECSDSAAAAAE